MKVIAEAGINHNGSIDAAKELIDVAKEYGCDYVKFQMYDTDRLFDKSFKYYEDSKRSMLDWSLFGDLFKYAESAGIQAFCSAFHVDAVEECEKIRMPVYKVASVSVTDTDLLKSVADTKKPVIMSTGNHPWNVIDKAVEIFIHNPLTILYCVPNYPTNFKEFDFRKMIYAQSRYNVPIGLSDHSKTYSAGLVASVLGAEAYEHHVTLSRTKFPNCDSDSSWEPHELKMFMKMLEELNGYFSIYPSRVS